MRSIISIGISLLLLSLSFTIQAKSLEADNSKIVPESHRAIFEMCLFKAIKIADKNATLAEIETQCEQKIARNIMNENSGQDIELGAIANRMIRE